MGMSQLHPDWRGDDKEFVPKPPAEQPSRLRDLFDALCAWVLRAR